jgi:hypothetical protein
MCHFSKYLGVFAVLLAAHCGASTAHDGTIPDAGPDLGKPQPDGVSSDREVTVPDRDASSDTEGGACCPISDAPACCMQYGGSPGPQSSCGTVCDGMPWPGYPGWEKRVNDKGCPFWWTPPDAPPGCNGIVPDARADADAKGGVDVSSDAEGGLCCPISPAPACCMQYGGSPGQFGCMTVCDGIPSPNYPGWERRTDANGCLYWWTPPEAPPGCSIPVPDARVDVDAPADADASLDAVSRPDVDAQNDAHHDGDAVECCPISPEPGCCMQFGGTSGPNFCGTVCDNLPAPTYPGWEQRVDANGCPYWWAPPSAPIGCGVDSGTFG